MECCTISFIEPIAGVEGQQLQFRTLGQIRWFVNDQPPAANTCLDGLEKRVSLQEPQALHPTRWLC